MAHRRPATTRPAGAGRRPRPRRPIPSIVSAGRRTAPAAPAGALPSTPARSTGPCGPGSPRASRLGPGRHEAGDGAARRSPHRARHAVRSVQPGPDPARAATRPGGRGSPMAHAADGLGPRSPTFGRSGRDRGADKWKQPTRSRRPWQGGTEVWWCLRLGLDFGGEGRPDRTPAPPVSVLRDRRPLSKCGPDLEVPRPEPRHEPGLTSRSRRCSRAAPVARSRAIRGHPGLQNRGVYPILACSPGFSGILLAKPPAMR